MANDIARLMPKVKIAAEGLEARAVLPMPPAGSEAVTYTRGMFKEVLDKMNITFGVDYDAIRALCDNPVFDTEVVIATGKPSEPGTPGYYEYFFQRDFSKKPVIRDDGTTDYMNIKTFEMVERGDLLATYHPAIQGHSGMNVRGIEIKPKPERELPPLIGRGFNKTKDGLTYTAAISGKIDLIENKLIISPIYEVKGDASIESGNITFNGDVVVHGGACDGVIVKASGNVTVEGLVENCEIYAGKDIFLLSGVKGGETAIIDAKGNITAEFIEYANVNCGGDLVGDVIFKSKVNCDGQIVLNGKKSSIIGGNTTALRGVDVNVIGNDFGTITHISVGVSRERLETLENLRHSVQALSDNVKKITLGLKEYERMAMERGESYRDDPRREHLLRVKTRDEAIVATQKEELEHLEELVISCQGATVRVFDTVYSGVDISIDDHRANILEYHKGVEFVKTLDGIRMEKLDGVIK